MNENINIPEYSLDAIKIAIETIQATSPELEELKNDLQHIANAIEAKKAVEIITCNKTICSKYPSIFSVANNYGLCKISEEELKATPLDIQLMVLHRIAHFLKDEALSEAISVKGEALAKSTALSAVEYIAKQLVK